MRISILDLLPLRKGQSSAQALVANHSLVELADTLGYSRFWFAEHHNTTAVATNPAVLIALAAPRTQRIKLGSGGVMLPNHAPMVIAEQFSLLEAAAPGRIDLGIGRAPGGDRVVNALLRGYGHASSPENFPAHVRETIDLMQPHGASVTLENRQSFAIHATPAAQSVPEVWLLGSSAYSAKLAADMGLPYVFANHFSSQDTGRLVKLYRDNFVPSEYVHHPRLILTANVVASHTQGRAHLLAGPHARQLSLLMSGQDLGTQDTVEAIAEQRAISPFTQRQDAMISEWIVDQADAAASRIHELADAFGIDEIMIVPVAGSSRQDPPDRSIGREETLRLLAERLL